MSESWLEHLEKAWEEVKDDDDVKQLDNEVYCEFGCSSPISFITSQGIKTMHPGKKYDENLNEISENKHCSCVNFYNTGDVVTCNCDVKFPTPEKTSDCTFEASKHCSSTQTTGKYVEGLKRE